MVVKIPSAAQVKEDAEVAEAVWKVVQTVGTKVRTVFEGIEKDARKYISNHFPRVHAEPNGQDDPVPDAVLVGPKGTEQFNAEDGFSPYKKESD